MRRSIVAALLVLSPCVALGAKDIFTNEGNSGITTVTVTIEATTLGANQTVTGQYQTVDGTATVADNDYVPKSGDFIIPAGTGSTQVTFQIVGDTKIEADETFTVQLTNVNGPILDAGPFVIHIVNDDVPVVTVSSPSVVEGNSGTTPMSFVVTLTTPAAVAVQAAYVTNDGTAKAGQDYQADTGNLTFLPGETTKVVNINVIGDTIFEANETFTLSVTPNGGTPATGTGTIVNDDVPSVTVPNASVTEGNSGLTPMNFVVTLTAASGTVVQATYRTTDGTAIAGQDYESASGTITFNPGQTQQTITVNVIGDTNFEPDETFTLTVTPIGGAAATATGTILNDDAVPLAALRIVSGNGQHARLGQTLPQPLVVEVTNTLGVAAGVTVDWKVTKGDASLTVASNTTNAQGRASNNATLNSVGAVEVQASVRGLQPVTFTLASETLFEQRASGPVAVPVARALDTVCAENDAAFAAGCRALSALDDAQLNSAFEHIAPQQSSAQSRMATEFVAQVHAGIQSRLRSLRGNVRRFDVQKLSLNFGGRPIPLSMASMALLPQQTTSTAEEEKDYSGWSGFLSGNLGTGERIRENGVLGFDLDTQGLMLGLDRQFGDAVIGVSANLANLDAKLNDAAGKVDTTSYALSVYGSRGGLLAASTPSAGAGTHFDGFHFDGSLTLGHDAYDTEHVVDISGLPLSRARSKNNAITYAMSGGAGLDAHSGRTDFELSLSANWSRTNVHNMSESGDGPFILFVQGHGVDAFVASGSFNVRSVWAVPFGDLLPSFRAEMLHDSESARLVTARFLKDPSNTSFKVPLDVRDANYGKLSAGLQAVFPHGVSAFVEVTQDVLRSDLHFRTVQVNVSKSF